MEEKVPFVSAITSHLHWIASFCPTWLTSHPYSPSYPLLCATKVGPVWTPGTGSLIQRQWLPGRSEERVRVRLWYWFPCRVSPGDFSPWHEDIDHIRQPHPSSGECPPLSPLQDWGRWLLRTSMTLGYCSIPCGSLHPATSLKRLLLLNSPQIIRIRVHIFYFSEHWWHTLCSNKRKKVLRICVFIQKQIGT